MIALDASALLAYMFRERGHETVGAAIGHSCMSTVNLSEVLGRFVRDGHDAETVLTEIGNTAIELVPFTQDHARAAADLMPKTRPIGLSLGDRACLALARSRGIPALTADRAWLGPGLDIEIRTIRD